MNILEKLRSFENGDELYIELADGTTGTVTVKDVWPYHPSQTEEQRQIKYLHVYLENIDELRSDLEDELKKIEGWNWSS